MMTFWTNGYRAVVTRNGKTEYTPLFKKDTKLKTWCEKAKEKGRIQDYEIKLVTEFTSDLIPSRMIADNTTELQKAG